MSSNYFRQFPEAAETPTNPTKEIVKEVNSEIKEIQRLLQKYDIVLKDDGDKKNLIIKFETFYGQLNEFVIKKRREISDVEKSISNLSGFSLGDSFRIVFNKKKDNANQIIDCNNQIVERIIELETTIHNNKMEELNKMKVEKYEVDPGMVIINNSMDKLKEWSNKNSFNILFDSVIDGDGSENVLHDKVFNKSNLYFITFDENNNVFGGYVDTKIDKDEQYISGKKPFVKPFVFSLIKNGNVSDKNKRYFMKENENNAFGLWSNRQNYWLYEFGNDIAICKVGYIGSWFHDGGTCKYDYKTDNKPLTDITNPMKFIVKRIIVLQME